MLLSVIITYYNEPLDMLNECVRSVMSLAEMLRGDVEIVVVDDGSTVSATTEPWAADSRVKYVRQSNQGLSAARNRGIEVSKGEYVQFLDADDMLLPAYEYVLGFLLEERPDVLMFRFARKQVANIGLRCNAPRVLCDCTGVHYLQTHNLRAAAWMYMARRDMLGTLRFHCGIYHEDELFTPQLLLKASRVIDTDAVAYFYRERQSSITTTKMTDRVEKRLDDTLYVIDQLRAVGHPALMRRIAQLTMDYIFNLHMLDGRDKSKTSRRVKELYDKGLLPLPLKAYTWKYLLFALITHLKK